MQMTVLLTIISTLLLPFVTIAQVPEVARSKAFTDSEYSSSRLLLMSNRNTLYFQFTYRKGISVTVYDSLRNAAPVVNNDVRSWKNRDLSEANLKGVFEMNGQAVVFLEMTVRREVNLYRFIFDGHTGGLLSEDLVESRKIPAVVLLPARNVIPRYYVRKDPASAFYAVAVYKDKKVAGDELIRVTHYTPAHQIISRATYTATGAPFSRVEFLDMYVEGGRFVTLASHLYKEGSFVRKGAAVMLSALRQEQHDSFQHALLDSTEDYWDAAAAMKYNQHTGQMYLLTSVHGNSVREKAIMRQHIFAYDYALQMTVFDPVSLQLRRQYFVDHPQLDAYVKHRLRYRNAYRGLIQDFYINDDNGVSLLFEEIYVDDKTSGPLTAIDSLTAITSLQKGYRTRLGQIGIVRLDADGREVSSYAIAKSQHVNTKIGMYYQYRRPYMDVSLRDRKPYHYGDIAGFYSYEYLPAKGVVIYNDRAANVANQEHDYRKIKDVYAMNETNTMLAVFDGEEVRRQYLFGEPANQREARFSELGVSAFRDDDMQYATVMVERKGRDHKAYIVWVQL
ncbi:hypothetical protein [Chitinophaga rhizophila]|uniref:Uncharacterized protein n=1 Tax=Chitinophaga rhizophila TaxID=2866212 RepID=A0ABS7GCQ7_9BACT|nr:hypothetical protein [Chitinophaga rhizophila]MBW8684584.1 hypothetical protein [Chitinophaga rhizophila]